ncbi:2585_t:CDS:2 [Dentiscutata heterogama]|uniref:2585_t:CDS:1 n=1 Tax=Dentiscutata heterogama TaxID=1316150 RepID=A0ACA9L9Y8_9GLOM|nr:2585_t:CDS:2 [Dentiscutata heterogama]
MALNKSLKTGHLYSGSDGNNSTINDNMDTDEIHTSKTTIKESKMKFKTIGQVIRKVVENDVKRAEKSLKALCDVMPPQLRLIMNGSSISEVFGDVNMEIQPSNEHKEQIMKESHNFDSSTSEKNANKEINCTQESNDLWQNNINHLNHQDKDNQVNIDEEKINEQELSTKSMQLDDNTQSEKNKSIEPTNNETPSTTISSSNKRKSTQPRKFIIEHHETESRIIRKRARPHTKKRKGIASGDESENIQAEISEASIYSVDDRDQVSQQNTEESSEDESISSYKHVKLTVAPSITENHDVRKQKGRRYSTRKIANPIAQKGKNSTNPSINSDQVNMSQQNGLRTFMKAARKFAAPVPKPAPVKPQRPLGSFGYFRKEMFDNRDSMLIGLPWRECIKIVAQRWNSLSEEDKEPYNELQRIASKRFKIENRVYLDYLKEHGLAEEKRSSKFSEKNVNRRTDESKKKNTLDDSDIRVPRKVSNNSLNKSSTISGSKTSANKNTIRVGAANHARRTGATKNIRAGAANHSRKPGVTKIFIPFVRKD